MAWTAAGWSCVTASSTMHGSRPLVAECIAARRNARRVFPTPPGPTSVTRRSVVEEEPHGVDVVVTAHEPGRVGHGRGRAATTVVGRRRLVDEQRRIVVEDPRFELPRRGREIEPEFVAEERPELVRLPERLALSAGAVQGHHELAPEALAQRMIDDETFELAHDCTGLAECQACFEEGFDRDQPKLVELHRVAPRPVEVARTRRTQVPSTTRVRFPSSSTTSAGIAAVVASRTRPAKRVASMQSGGASRR